MSGSFRLQVEQARRAGGLHFAALLPEQVIEETLGEARATWHGWLYTPAITVWMFLAQVLSSDHSCRETVARLLADRAARGQKKYSAQTGAYCTARDKLPEEFCHRLMALVEKAFGSTTLAEVLAEPSRSVPLCPFPNARPKQKASK